MSDDGPLGVEATLTLADWRRRVGALYADVRRLAATDPVEALSVWRQTRERLFREHPQSPVPAADRANFRSRHFDHDPALRFEVVVEELEAEPGVPESDDDGPFGGLSLGGLPAFSIDLPVSGGGAMAFRRFATVTVPFPAGPRRLELFWMEGYAG